MASNRKLIWILSVITTLALFVCLGSTTDDFYHYELDDLPGWEIQPHLRLLNKRQVSGTAEEPKKEKEVNEKKLLFKDKPSNQTDTPENSSNKSIPVTSSTLLGDANTDMSKMTDTTTVLPSMLDSDTQKDYDGNKVVVTNTTYDHHRYYNSSTYLNQGMQFWVDFDNENVSTHDMLSTSHRRAATVPLSFDFPFYGHLVRNITIATGGFLYTGDYVHSWLAATQYIAPLMANFDTSMSNSSTIKYMDNGTAFSVQWDNVALQDKPTAGNFSFQATLLKSGDIIFAYKEIPINVSSIADEAHPVKVGVSDAYIIDRTIFFVRRKTIYEYHKVDKKTDDVSSNSAIYFTALPTCVGFNSCESCVGNGIGFECVWCSSADRCSDGMDRYRQDWLVKGCDKFFVDSKVNCSLPPPLQSTTTPAVVPSDTFFTTQPSKFSTSTTPSTTTPYWDDFDNTASRIDTTTGMAAPTSTEKISLIIPGARTNTDDSEDAKASNVSSVVGILFLVAMLVGCSGWLFYAYRNPHTPSGQCFIRYRPSQWRWRSGEAHYTAAAIHM